MGWGQILPQKQGDGRKGAGDVPAWQVLGEGWGCCARPRHPNRLAKGIFNYYFFNYYFFFLSPAKPKNRRMGSGWGLGLPLACKMGPFVFLQLVLLWRGSCGSRAGCGDATAPKNLPGPKKPRCPFSLWDRGDEVSPSPLGWAERVADPAVHQIHPVEGRKSCGVPKKGLRRWKREAPGPY